MEHVILLGAPGSGKSTLAAGFIEAINHESQRDLDLYSSTSPYEYISSGEIARQFARHDEFTEGALQRGEYAPEAAMRVEVMAQIERAEHHGKSVILEGFPRTLAQLVIVEGIMTQQIHYIEVFCPLLICLRRIIDRGRHTDQPDAIASRFMAYQRDTVPIIDMVCGHNNKINTYILPPSNCVEVLKRMIRESN